MPADVVPGDLALAYCKACKKVVEHSVVAVRGSRPFRVRCNTCEEAHPYRASAPAKKETAASAAHRWGQLPAGVSYETLMQGRDPAEAATYSMSQQFGNADMITHSVFGVGLVTRVLDNRKIEVLFADGMKMLAHER